MSDKQFAAEVQRLHITEKMGYLEACRAVMAMERAQYDIDNRDAAEEYEALTFGE